MSTFRTAGTAAIAAGTGATGPVDEFTIATDGTLRSLGSVTVPNATGGEGITAE